MPMGVWPTTRHMDSERSLVMMQKWFVLPIQEIHVAVSKKDVTSIVPGFAYEPSALKRTPRYRIRSVSKFVKAGRSLVILISVWLQQTP